MGGFTIRHCLSNGPGRHKFLPPKFKKGIVVISTHKYLVCLRIKVPWGVLTGMPYLTGQRDDLHKVAQPTLLMHLNWLLKKDPDYKKCKVLMYKPCFILYLMTGN